MYSIAITIAAIICAAGWLFANISCRALLKWIYDRCGELPGPEINECVDWVLEQMLK